MCLIGFASFQSEQRINQKSIDKLYADIIGKIDNQNGLLNVELKKQRQAEEQDRLRKIQESLEMERRQKEEEERQAREDEENRRKKAEIETKRKLEEIERKRQEEEDRKAAEALQVSQAQCF